MQASGGGGRGKTRIIVEHDTSERWMASYMDMVTVLMCLFIVLFAMSTVDAKKYSQLKNSLATGFGVVSSQTVDTASGVVVPPNLVDQNGDLLAVADKNVQVTQVAKAQYEQLKQLQATIQSSLDAQGVAGSVQFFSDQRGIGVRLLGDQAFFASGSAQTSALAQKAIDAIGTAVAATGRSLQVEGHADARAISGTYASNWELSSARATAVLRRLVEVDGIDPAKIGSVGYGSARPLGTGTSAADLALNRRTDIVILTDEKDPAVAAAVASMMNGAATSTTSTATTGTDASGTSTSTGVSTGSTPGSTGSTTGSTTTGSSAGH